MKIKSNWEEPANTNSTQLSPNRTRTLKIEERGDAWTKKIYPAVRLKGKWLQTAGFPPGQRLTVKIVSPGVIEMRVCGKPMPTEAFHIAAMRLDHAITAAEAPKAQAAALK
jgi:Toxin SymE, type I toxin-antitoxin system